MRTGRMFALVATLAVAGCNGDEDETTAPDPFLQTLQGTWRSCDNDGQTDFGEDLIFASGTSGTSVLREYATTNGTCGGAPTATDAAPVSFVLGGNVPATMRISGAAVTARAIDVTILGDTFYSIVYVDTAATPDVLYTGDDPFPGDPLHDGSTAEKRHVLLNDGRPRVKQ